MGINRQFYFGRFFMIR